MLHCTRLGLSNAELGHELPPPSLVGVTGLAPIAAAPAHGWGGCSGPIGTFCTAKKYLSFSPSDHCEAASTTSAPAPPWSAGYCASRRQARTRVGALALTCIVRVISSNGSSTRSSSVGVSTPATTNSQPTTSPSSDCQLSASGCELIIPRPNSILVSWSKAFCS